MGDPVLGGAAIIDATPVRLNVPNVLFGGIVHTAQLLFESPAVWGVLDWKPAVAARASISAVLAVAVSLGGGELPYQVVQRGAQIVGELSHPHRPLHGHCGFAATVNPQFPVVAFLAQYEVGQLCTQIGGIVLQLAQLKPCLVDLSVHAVQVGHEYYRLPSEC